jgi:hypothetical protein
VTYNLKMLLSLIFAIFGATIFIVAGTNRERNDAKERLSETQQSISDSASRKSITVRNFEIFSARSSRGTLLFQASNPSPEEVLNIDLRKLLENQDGWVVKKYQSAEVLCRRGVVVFLVPQKCVKCEREKSFRAVYENSTYELC